MTLRVAHVITTLDIGGAELLLHRLVRSLPDSEVAGSVICLAAPGDVAPLITAAGWGVHSIGMQPGRVRAKDLRKLHHLLRQAAPQIVHTWMYHADLLGGVVAWAQRRPVLWSLHQSDLPPGALKRGTRAVARTCAVLSGHIPAAIACTSEASRNSHVDMGYRGRNMIVIPTAFDTVEPEPGTRRRIRAGLGIPDEALVVGRVARDHPQKDYPSFLKAAADVLRAVPHAHVVALGRAVDWQNPRFADAIGNDVKDRVHLLGEQLDAASYPAAFDVAVSSSAFGESTPLVIGEAMAGGVPVVTTDVGDCAVLVGDTGRVVPPRDPHALAEAIRDILRLPALARSQLGEAARQRVEAHYSMEVMVRRYVELYSRLAAMNAQA